MSALALLLAAVPAAAGTLPLTSYLAGVAERHEGVKAAAQAEAGSLRRADEADLPLVPSLFFEGERSLDASPKNFPAAEGERAERLMLRAGVEKKTLYGAAGRVYYLYGRTDLNGADPNFVRPPSFYSASPVAELSLSLWRDALGKEARAAASAARESALARARRARFERKRLLAEAEGTYWGLAAARRKAAIAKDSLARAEKLRDWTAGRVARSLADAAEGLEADAAARLRALEARAASDALRAAERAFADRRGGLSAAPDDELSPLDDDGARPRRSASPDDAAAAAHEARASAGAAVLGAEATRPRVEVFAAGSLNGRRAAGDDAATDSFGPRGPRYAVGVRAAVPLDPALLSGVREGHRLEAGAAASLGSRRELESRDAWADLEAALGDARERLTLSRALEAAQRARAEAERRRQAEGRTTTFFVLQSEQDWASAQLARVDAELAVKLALAALRPYAED